MSRFWRSISANRTTLLMLAAILTFYGLHLAGSKLESRHTGGAEVLSRSEASPTTAQIKERELLFTARMQQDGWMLTAFSLFIFFVLLAGLIVDLQILGCLAVRRRWIRFEPESASDAPDWRMTNVVEFCVLLLFLEIVFYVSWSAAVSLAGLKSFNSDCLLVLSTIFRDVVAAVYIVRVVRGRMGCPVSALGLDGRYLWSKAWIGVKAYLAVIPLLMMCFMVLSVILQRMAYEPPPQKVVQIYLSNSNDNFLAVLTVFVAVVGPALEEIFFRGFIYRVFRKRLGVFWGIAISAAIFALIHFNLVAAVPIFLLGVFLAVLYYRTGSLAAPIAAHITHNLLMVAMTLVFKTITS